MSFLDGPGPRIIAHRRLALDAPENTLLAFLHALTAGATHLETDVRATSDGVAVVSHDPDLTRVAHIPSRVSDLRMRELRQIDLGHGQTFPSLTELLDTFPEARINLDIKDKRAAAPTVEAIRAARATGRVLVTSFAKRRRKAVTAMVPTVAASPSVSEIGAALLAARTATGPLVRRALRGFAAVQLPERRGPARLDRQRPGRHAPPAHPRRRRHCDRPLRPSLRRRHHRVNSSRTLNHRTALAVFCETVRVLGDGAPSKENPQLDGL